MTAKRLVDLVVASVMLVLALPLCVPIVAIRGTIRG